MESKLLHNVKRQSSNSLFLLFLTFSEFLIVAIWKLSSALFVLIVAAVRLIVIILKMVLGPLVHKGVKKMEEATEKVSETTRRMENPSRRMDQATKKMEDEMYLNKGV
jgi:hypothetical protein